MNKLYGMDEYAEGQDFCVEKVVPEKKGDFLKYQYFFRDMKGGLLAYMQFNVEIRQGDPTAYIIDTSSAGGFKHFGATFQEFYRANGYVEGNKLDGFGRTAFAYVLASLKTDFPTMRIVLVNAHEKNEAKVWDLIQDVEKRTTGLIDKITGGNQMNMATIFV